MSLTNPGDNQKSAYRLEDLTPTIENLDMDYLLRGPSIVWDFEWNYGIPTGIDHVGQKDSKRVVRLKHRYMIELAANQSRLNTRYIQRPV